MNKKSQEEALTDSLEDFLSRPVVTESEIFEFEKMLRLKIESKELADFLDQRMVVVRSRIINGRFSKSHKFLSIFTDRHNKLFSDSVKKDGRIKNKLSQIENLDKLEKTKVSRENNILNRKKKKKRISDFKKIKTENDQKIIQSDFRPANHTSTKSSIWTVKNK